MRHAWLAVTLIVVSGCTSQEKVAPKSSSSVSGGATTASPADAPIAEPAKDLPAKTVVTARPSPEPSESSRPDQGSAATPERPGAQSQTAGERETTVSQERNAAAATTAGPGHPDEGRVADAASPPEASDGPDVRERKAMAHWDSKGEALKEKHQRLGSPYPLPFWNDARVDEAVQLQLKFDPTFQAQIALGGKTADEALGVAKATLKNCWKLSTAVIEFAAAQRCDDKATADAIETCLANSGLFVRDGEPHFAAWLDSDNGLSWVEHFVSDAMARRAAAQEHERDTPSVSEPNDPIRSNR